MFEIDRRQVEDKAVVALGLNVLEIIPEQPRQIDNGLNDIQR